MGLSEDPRGDKPISTGKDLSVGALGDGLLEQTLGLGNSSGRGVTREGIGW